MKVIKGALRNIEFIVLFLMTIASASIWISKIEFSFTVFGRAQNFFNLLTLFIVLFMSVFSIAAPLWFVKQGNIDRATLAGIFSIGFFILWVIVLLPLFGFVYLRFFLDGPIPRF